MARIAKSAVAPVAAKAAPKAKASKAKLAVVKDADTIVTFQTVNRGRVADAKDPQVVAVTETGDAVTINTTKLTKDLQKLMVVGGSLAAVKAYIAAMPKPVLGRGIASTDAPNSAKAVADAKAKSPAATVAKADKPAKLPVIAKAAGKGRADGDTPFTVLVAAADSGVRPGTDRYERLAAVAKAKTLAEALASRTTTGKAIAMDNIRGMEKRGHIKIG